MKRALVVLAAALLSAGCAQQDAAVLVTFAGQWRYPEDGDQLTVDVADKATRQTIKHVAYPLSAALPATLTLVEGSGAHPSITIRASLQITRGSTGTTAQGVAEAQLASGQTAHVTVTLVPAQ